MAYTRSDWSQHYTDGRRFQALGDREKHLLAEHTPPPGRAVVERDQSAGAHLGVVTLPRLRDRHGITGAFRAAGLAMSSGATGE